MKDMQTNKKEGKLMKKGQITTFVIIGIVLVILILLFFYIRGFFFFGPVTTESLGERLKPIQEHVETCLEEVGNIYVDRIGLQGGYLKTAADTYRLHKDIPVSYLCFDIEKDFRCRNRMLTKAEMEKQLNEVIEEGMATCLNVQQFRRGFEIQTGKLKVNTDVGRDKVIVNADFPVMLKKGEVVVEENEFSININAPLGRLYDVSMDIVNTEAETGNFEQVSYMLDHRGQYVIEKKKPYPDKLYIITSKDNEYVFQFFIQDGPWN